MVASPIADELGLVTRNAQFMTSIPWYYYVVMILSSGAVGSIITLLFKKYQGRIQPVSKSVRLIRVFGSMSGKSSLDAHIVVEKDDKRYDYDNLYVASVSIANSGNQDYEQFNFGLTLPEHADIIHVDTFSEDRHHEIRKTTDLGLDNPTKKVDFTLSPFNRQDSYKFDMHIVLAESSLSSTNISFSTPHPVRFVNHSQAADVAAEVALEIVKRSLLPFA